MPKASSEPQFCSSLLLVFFDSRFDILQPRSGRVDGLATWPRHGSSRFPAVAACCSAGPAAPNMPQKSTSSVLISQYAVEHRSPAPAKPPIAAGERRRCRSLAGPHPPPPAHPNLRPLILSQPPAQGPSARCRQGGSASRAVEDSRRRARLRISLARNRDSGCAPEADHQG